LKVGKQYVLQLRVNKLIIPWPLNFTSQTVTNFDPLIRSLDQNEEFVFGVQNQGDPIGRFFAYWAIFLMTEVAHIFRLLFVMKFFVLILAKTGFGRFWAICSQGHPVTLFWTVGEKFVPIFVVSAEKSYLKAAQLFVS
jgi:hypothetical protein